MRIEREYHGVPLWVMRDYLIELGGTMIGEDCVRGGGWSATFREGEPVTLGVLRFGTIQGDFDGDAVVLNRVLAAFDLKMIRAGG